MNVKNKAKVKRKIGTIAVSEKAELLVIANSIGNSENRLVVQGPKNLIAERHVQSSTKEFIMKTNRFLLAAGILLAMAFTFSCSGGGGGGDNDTASGSSLCAGEVYDSDLFRCDAGELIGKCAGKDYYPAYQQCNNGVIEDKNPLLSSNSTNTSSSSVKNSTSCGTHYLGKGYNVITSAYIHPNALKANSNWILDQDKLCQANIIVTSEESRDQKVSVSAGKSITQLYEERNKEIGVGVNFFAGGFDTKFNTKKDETSTSQVFYSQLRSYTYRRQDRINTNTQNLSQYLTKEFADDLKSNKTPEQIISLYGTHVFISYKKGGYLEANATYSGTSLQKTDEVKMAFEASYKIISLSASSSDYTKELEKEENTTFNFLACGGKSLSATNYKALTNTDYDRWISSIQAETDLEICGIGDFDKSLVPIWELAEGTRATALKNAFNKLAADQGIAFPKAKMFEAQTRPFTGTGTITSYSMNVTNCPECTIVEVEIYALGAGGGGQGGDYTTSGLNTHIGTGGAGGGGAATYARLGKLGLTKGQAISFDNITIGKGGSAGNQYPMTQSDTHWGEHSGGNGGKGGDTQVTYKGATITAKGGSQGGGNSPLTTGGDGGGTSTLPTSSPYYISGRSFAAPSGTAPNGGKGTTGDWKNDLRSVGGTAASIIDSGTIKEFRGGIGGVRPLGGAGITDPGIGGGGSGGYALDKGKAGGNGALTIVLKYFREEDKASAPESSNNIISSSSTSLWDLSMGMGFSTGGGWYGYDDQGVNNGYSSVLFRDATNNQFYPSNDVMEWDGGVNFSIDPNGFEYAYAGIGFVWLEGAAAAPNIWGNHTGVCLEYSLSGGGDYYLRITTTSGYTEDNEFKVTLPKQASVAKKLFSFNDFQQGLGWGLTRTLAGAKQNSIGMQIQGEAPLATIENGYEGYTTTQTGTFTLKSIRWDSCN